MILVWSNQSSLAFACVIEVLLLFIFEEVFASSNIPWSNYLALSVDSASVNIGRHNSIKSRLELKIPSVYTLGCPCHFIHNAAHAAANKLGAAARFDVKGLAVDIYYYFDHCTKKGRAVLAFVMSHTAKY